MTAYARVELASGRLAYARVDEAGALWLLSKAPWERDCAETQERVLASETRRLVPSDASKVVCVGQNYRKHAQEMGKPVPVEPLLFIKPSTALNPDGAAIVLPPASREVHYEAELGLVIGRRLKDASEEEARAGIFAATCINDVTARDIQRKETQHTRAKSYDTFACVGPVMVTGLDVSALRVQCRLDGQTKQDGHTSDMVFSPAALVSFISQVMTLLPGDLVSTGTPSGVGPMVAGQTVEVELEGIGTLRNPVRPWRERVFVGLGSNLGDRREHLDAALKQLAALPGTELVAVAPVIETPALLPSPDAPAQPAYLNTVAELTTTLEPKALMEALLRIEAELGRVRSTRWAARTIDLDLLRYGARRIDEPGVIVPHPRMHERRFVMEPLEWLLSRP